jgi:hypothetical protein
MQDSLDWVDRRAMQDSMQDTWKVNQLWVQGLSTCVQIQSTSLCSKIDESMHLLLIEKPCKIQWIQLIEKPCKISCKIYGNRSTFAPTIINLCSKTSKAGHGLARDRE